MKASIYEKLREQLDQYSVGFPATQSGVEIKILKRLFTEDEAGMYLDMSMMLETPEAIAARTGRKAGGGFLPAGCHGPEGAVVPPAQRRGGQVRGRGLRDRVLRVST